MERMDTNCTWPPSPRRVLIFTGATLVRGITSRYAVNELRAKNTEVSGRTGERSRLNSKVGSGCCLSW